MDDINSIYINVEVQENGIIRTEDGLLIARLVDSCEFDSLKPGTSNKQLLERLSEGVEKMKEYSPDYEESLKKDPYLQAIEEVKALIQEEIKKS